MMLALSQLKQKKKIFLEVCSLLKSGEGETSGKGGGQSIATAFTKAGSKEDKSKESACVDFDC